MTPDELEDALARHLAPEPVSDPRWIRELDSSVSPALFEALMLRQRMIETLVSREEEARAVSVAVAGSFVRCPFCHSEVVPQATDWVACRSCLARHHAPCWNESGRCGTCGHANPLPSSVPTRAIPRWLVPAAAAAAMFVAVLVGIGTFTRDGRAERVASLLNRALHPVAGATIDERLALALAARALAPDDLAVQEAVKKLEGEKARLVQDDAEARALEVKRLDDAVAQFANERETARTEAATVRGDLAKERDAESKRAAAREERARELVEQAEALKPTPEAVLLLARALALSARESKVHDQAEWDMLKVELALARRAVDLGDARVAGSWLREIDTLDVAKSNPSPVGEVRALVENLANGKKDLADAAAYLEDDKLLEARRAYQRALDRGVAADEVEPELAKIATRCSERADRLVTAARSCLEASKPYEAVAMAKEAAKYEPSNRALLALYDTIDQALVTRGQRDADRFAASADDKGTLAALDRAVAAMHNKEAAELTLKSERAQRQRFIDTPDLKAKFIYVRGTEVGKPYLIARNLVTNEEFKQFVTAGGYEKAEYWTTRRARDSYKDKDGRSGPRGWKNGSFTSGTERDPVSGITVDEAIAYTVWLSRGERPDSYSRSALTFRLPTSTEWSVAAGYDPTSEKMREYPWGDQFEPSALMLEAKSPPAAGRGMKRPSPMGLVDACGSLRQWVLEGQTAGLKGSDFACDKKKAEKLARVSNTAEEVEKGDELLHCGFRLVRVFD